MIAELDILNAVGDFLHRYMPVDCEVAASQQNYTVLPDCGTFVIVQVTMDQRLSTNQHVVSDTEENETISSDDMATVQIDFYGDQAHTNAKTIELLLRDDVGVQFFKQYEMAPLYHDNMANNTGVDATNIYRKRYTLPVQIFYNASVVLEQQYFTEFNAPSEVLQ